jgi:hypothetical protein
VELATGTGAAPVKEADHGHHRTLELLMIIVAMRLLLGADRLLQTDRPPS